jgi:hypothetical protein
MAEDGAATLDALVARAAARWCWWRLPGCPAWDADVSQADGRLLPVAV